MEDMPDPARPETAIGESRRRRRQRLVSPGSNWQEIRAGARSANLDDRKKALREARLHLIRFLEMHGTLAPDGRAAEAFRKFARGGYVGTTLVLDVLDALDLRNDAEYRSYQPSAEEAAAAVESVAAVAGMGPAAAIIRVTDSFDQQGLSIHVSFNVFGMKGARGAVGAYFYLDDGTCPIGRPLRDQDGQYASPDGQVATGSEFTPEKDDASFDRFQLFLPRAQLHVDDGRFAVRYALRVFKKEAQGWSLLARSDPPL